MIQKDTFRDKLIPWYFVAFFVVLLIINIIFVSLALDTHIGVVTENPYEEGLNYNKTIENAQSQAKLRWQTDIQIKRNVISFLLKDKEGMVLKEAKVTAHLTYVKDSFTVPLTVNTAGIYQENFEFPHKGKWDIRIVTLWKKQQFQSHKQIVLR